jgi:hypothetical protein
MAGGIEIMGDFFKLLAESASLNLDDLIDNENGVFWYFTYACIAATVIFIVLYLLYILELQIKYPNSDIASNLKSISDYLLPLLGNLAFLPIISIFLDLFVCDETLDEDGEEPILSSDCK